MGRIGAAELIVMALFLIPYFIPTIIALIRKKSNTTAIFLLNFFLGWTFVGWIVSLIWAVTKDKEQQTIVINNNAYTDRTINPILTQPARENFENDTLSKTLSSNVVDSEIPKINSYQDKIENLQKLKALLDAGILNQEEFDQQKAQILA